MEQLEQERLQQERPAKAAEQSEMEWMGPEPAPPVAPGAPHRFR